MDQYPSVDLDKDGVAADGSDRILGFIKRRGPQRVSALAAALGITNEAVRQQVARLERLGLVRAMLEPQTVGRPARSWALTDAGHARFPDRHSELTVQLIETVRDEFGESALERMIERREREMLRDYGESLVGARGLGERVRRLAALRTREGYMAEATAVPGGWQLTENHCPICAAATACQQFCRSERDVFQAALGDDVTVERTDHILAGARRCAYAITPKETIDGMDRRHGRRGTRGKEEGPRAR